MTKAERTKEYKRLYDQGLTLAQIAERFGVTRQAVHMNLKRHFPEGADGYVPNKKLVNAIYPRLAQELANRGMRIGDLGAVIGKTDTSAWYKFRNSGKFKADERQRLSLYFGVPAEILLAEKLDNSQT